MGLEELFQDLKVELESCDDPVPIQGRKMAHFFVVWGYVRELYNEVVQVRYPLKTAVARCARLAWQSGLVDRELTTSSELTNDELTCFIRFLEGQQPSARVWTSKDRELRQKRVEGVVGWIQERLPQLIEQAKEYQNG